jgi:PAS domain S-box-containing protein
LSGLLLPLPIRPSLGDEGCLRLRTKFLVSLCLVTACLTSATLLVVRQDAQRRMQREIQQDAQNTILTFQAVQHQRHIVLSRKADLLAGLALMRNGDATTIQDLTENPWESDDCDLFALADATGALVALRTADSDFPVDTAQSLLHRSLKEGNYNWWYSGRRLYQVVSQPFYDPNTKGRLLGSVVVGHGIDPSASEFRQLASSQLAFRYGTDIFASTLSSAQQSDLARQLRDSRSEQVQLAGERFFVSSIDLAPGQPAVTLTVLKSYAETSASLRKLNHLLIGLGVLAIIAGSGLGFVIADAFTRPLASLVGGVQALERDDYVYPLLAQGQDEVAQVTRAFDRMRDTLKKNDSQRKALEEQLRQAQKMEAMGRLAGGVAHDFNNLLTVIKGHSDILLDPALPADKVARSALQIDKAADRATSLTRQLLAFCRMQVLQPKLLDLNALVSEMSKLLKRLVREDIAFSFLSGENLGHVRADPGQLEQVIMNLIVNACDAMPKGGKLLVETRNVAVDADFARAHVPMSPGHYVLLAVSDTGHGMDAETKARVFEPFFTTKEQGKGTGLGLATVYGVVKQSGGCIWVDSEPGKGARFEIYLPLVPGRAEDEVVSETPSRAGASELVLIVEDEAEVRELAAEFMKLSGYRVLLAKDGEEALEVFRSSAEAIRTVVTDVVMPRMRGPELAKRLRSLRPDLTVVYMSGYLEFNRNSEEFVGDAFFLQKPFTRASLTNKVAEALGAVRVAQRPCREEFEARPAAGRGLRLRHPTLLLLFYLLCTASLRAGQPRAQKSDLPLLTQVEQIRNLSLDEANRGYRVRVRAVVTYYDLERNPAETDLFIQDSTAGIWVDLGSAKPEVHPGQLVEVEGFSEAPDFAPQIAKPQIRVLGEAPLPEAKQVTFNRMASTKEDSQWVEVGGIVHAARKQEDALFLDVAVDTERVIVKIPHFLGALPTFLVDAEVRVRGVCGTIFNQKNQMIGVILYSASLSQVHIVEQALTDPFSVAIRPIASLLRFNPLGASRHLVRVKGTVTLQQPGRSLFIRDGNYGLYVHTAETTPVRAGDLVEVVGFPAVGEYSAVLQDAVFRRTGEGPLPQPNAVTATQALDGSHDADYVSIEARLLEGALGAGRHTLNMKAGNTVFQAELEDAQSRNHLETLAPGSLFKLTGICVVGTDENHNPRDFRIFMRSLDDIAVVQLPSWWTIGHLGMLIAVLAGMVFAFVIWTTALKQQVREKTEAIREGLERETQARERYEELFENASDMVFTCDQQGRLLALNKAGRRMIGIGPGEELKMSLAEILAPEYGALTRQVLQQASQEGQETHEVEIVGSGKVRLRVELAARLIQRDGYPVEIEGIGRDITRRRKLEEQLRQAQKMEAVGRLAGGVAHDFNNLLTVISGCGELALGHLDPADPKYRHVADVLKAADRAASLTRQLLAFSRKQVLQPQVLDLNITLASVASMLRRVIREDVELKIVPGEGLGRVKADPGEIERAILNLAVNARDAMPQGGKLTLRTENVSLDESYAGAHYPIPAGQYVLLSVSDTGSGMDAETQRHIFEPFFTTKEIGKGTGLGLAAVHGIVSQSRGHISVYSEPGKGTCFKIYFPRLDPVTKPSQDSQVNQPDRRGSETILLVEDEAMVRELTFEVLKESGYVVLPAQRPDEALKICEECPGRIDLLLTDVVMPGMSGLELAKRLKPGRPEMKILFVSGYTADAVTEDGISHPNAAFLQKPYAPAALLRKVHEILMSPASNLLEV